MLHRLKDLFHVLFLILFGLVLSCLVAAVEAKQKVRPYLLAQPLKHTIVLL